MSFRRVPLDIAGGRGEKPEALVGIEAAARFLDVKVSWLYEQVRLGRVPSYRVGKFRRFRISELEAWLRTRKDSPGGA